MIETVLWVLAQVVVGLLYANLMEWVIHRYILHGIGKNAKSWFSFHWWNHHRISRLNEYYDNGYETSWWSSSSRRKEIYSLAGLVFSHVWVIFFAPVFWLTLAFGAFLYYFVHKKSHTDVAWGKKWTKWHYDHHQGLNQNANWCVTFPFWDYVFGTRIMYTYDEKNRAKYL